MDNASKSLKRFYDNASVRKNERMYGIDLDDRPLKTPSGTPLIVSCPDLAQAICDEWNNQHDYIIASNMPLYGILVTQIDKTDTQRSDITKELIPYIDGDLLFYHTPDPEGLRISQERVWGDILKCAEQHTGQKFTITHALDGVQQSPYYHDYVLDKIETLSAEKFTVFHILTALTGSIILPILCLDGQLKADDVMNAIHLEEDYYIALYKDQLSDDQHAKRQDLFNNIEHSLRYLSLST